MNGLKLQSKFATRGLWCDDTIRRRCLQFTAHELTYCLLSEADYRQFYSEMIALVALQTAPVMFVEATSNFCICCA